MKLENAKYCLDCDEVFDRAQGDACPACAGEVTVGLTSWIGGPLRMVKPAAIAEAQPPFIADVDVASGQMVALEIAALPTVARNDGTDATTAPEAA